MKSSGIYLHIEIIKINPFFLSFYIQPRISLRPRLESSHPYFRFQLIRLFGYLYRAFPLPTVAEGRISAAGAAPPFDTRLDLVTASGPAVFDPAELAEHGRQLRHLRRARPGEPKRHVGAEVEVEVECQGRYADEHTDPKKDGG